MIDNFEICTNLEYCLNQLEQKGKIAVGITRSYALNEQNPLNPQFYCFEKSEHIYEYDPKILMRKKFPHQKRLNRFIEMASESGLIEKWRKKTGISTKKMEIIQNNIKSNNFHGIFIAFTVLSTSIVLIFILERFVHKKAQASNPSTFWLYLDMHISADRFFWLENRWN